MERHISFHFLLVNLRDVISAVLIDCTMFTKETRNTKVSSRERDQGYGVFFPRMYLKIDISLVHLHERVDYMVSRHLGGMLWVMSKSTFSISKKKEKSQLASASRPITSFFILPPRPPLCTRPRRIVLAKLRVRTCDLEFASSGLAIGGSTRERERG
jgi:hypothetical protein